MRLDSKKLIFSLFFLGLATSPGFLHGQQGQDSALAGAQANTDSSRFQSATERTPVLAEIKLSSEGVTAVDTAGGRWTYDFERLQFTATQPASASDTRGREPGGNEEAVPSAEVRCTERKVVDYPALTAVYVGRDEYVEGDIVAYSRVTIKGWVKGNVQSLNKAVLITSTGRVDGNVQAPQVEIKNGGVVLGKVIETPAYEIPVDVIKSGVSMAGMWVVFGFALASLLVAFLALSLAPVRMATMNECIAGQPVKSALMGFMFVFLLPVIILLVCLTVVGLLVVWMVPLAYFAAFTVGMCSTGYLVSVAVMRRLGRPRPGTWLGSLLGVTFFMGLWALTALTLGVGNEQWSGSEGTGVLLLVISILVTCYPLLAGIGAAVMTRFGSRPYVRRKSVFARSTEPAPAPAPPPIPEGPSDFTPRIPRPPTGPMPADPADSRRFDTTEN